RSARLASASARLASTSRRTRPHRSASQLTVPPRLYWLVTPVAPARLPAPEREAPALAPTTGKNPARAPCTRACACRQFASAWVTDRLDAVRRAIRPASVASP